MLIFNGEHNHKVNPTDGTYIRSYINFFPHFVKSNVDNELYKKMKTLFKTDNGTLIRWDLEERIEIENIMSEIIEESRKEAVGYQSMILSYLAQILIKIYRKSNGVYINVSVKLKEQHAQRILKYINENYMNQLSLDTIAETFHVNKYYMCHSSKEVTGFTISKYLAQKRIEEGKKLLLTTEQTVSSISTKIGLNSAVQFGRLFKHYENIPPKHIGKGL